MNPIDFWHKIEEHSQLQFCIVCEEEQEVIVKHVGLSSFAVPLLCIKESGWEELEAILTEKRTPIVLHQLARIVGYFSNVQQWNKSKYQELLDRRRGQYILPVGTARQEASDACDSGVCPLQQGV